VSQWIYLKGFKYNISAILGVANIIPLPIGQIKHQLDTTNVENKN
jgi:hypothetical protein